MCVEIDGWDDDGLITKLCGAHALGACTRHPWFVLPFLSLFIISTQTSFLLICFVPLDGACSPVVPPVTIGDQTINGYDLQEYIGETYDHHTVPVVFINGKSKNASSK